MTGDNKFRVIIGGRAGQRKPPLRSGSINAIAPGYILELPSPELIFDNVIADLHSEFAPDPTDNGAR